MADSTLLYQIREANKSFLAGHPQPLDSTGAPFVVIACIDSRITGLLEPAMGLPRNRASVVRTAGNRLSEKNVDALRSIAVALYIKQAQEILVVGHTDCAMAGLSVPEVTENFRRAGIPRSAFGDDDLRTWFGAFADIRDNVKTGIDYLRRSGVVPGSTKIHGLILDTDKGTIEVVVDGYAAPQPAVASATATASDSRADSGDEKRAGEQPPATHPDQPPLSPPPAQPASKPAKGPVVIGQAPAKKEQAPAPPDSIVEAVMVLRDFFKRERQTQQMQQAIAELKRIWKLQKSPYSIFVQLKKIAHAYQTEYPELPGALAYLEDAVRSGSADRIGFGEIMKRIFD